ESLQKQYTDLVSQRDQELLGLEQNAGFSKSYLNKELTYAEQKWNLRLSAQAGIINTKAAIMKLKDENYTMANQYINQAVTNATAELKLQYDRYDKLRQDNKDLFDDLGDDYRTVYATSEKKALMDYQTAQNEKTQIGNMMLDYPDAPWTANSMSLSLGEAAQIAAQSQKYQLELQSQQADISKTYYDMMPEKMAETSGDILTDAQNVFSGVLDKSKLSTKDNYASKVMAEVAKLRQEALDRGDFYGLMASSGGGKDPSEAAILAIEKESIVVYQIDGLQEIFNNEKEQKTFASEVKRLTGVDISPAWGKLRSFNPYDKDAQSIKASLQAIVPTLARGIYGEVGVLTDYDVKNYIKTLPTLSSTEDVRKMVLGITIRTIQRSIENKIKSNVAGGRDMSGYKDMYQEVKSVTAKLLGEELTSSGEGILSDQEAYEEYLKM
ncbi:MAG TPA: hypothetical protein PLA19_05745, partial [Candidatus Pacearchaeota archaeon]|nr:hypothetical protein [Candidatus Pacearchaeota archaeon]